MNVSKWKGFTLVELLIVIAVTMIIVFLGAAGYREFQARNDLRNSARQLISELRYARDQATVQGRESPGPFPDMPGPAVPIRCRVATGDLGGVSGSVLREKTFPDAIRVDTSQLNGGNPGNVAIAVRFAGGRWLGFHVDGRPDPQPGGGFVDLPVTSTRVMKGDNVTPLITYTIRVNGVTGEITVTPPLQ